MMTEEHELYLSRLILNPRSREVCIGQQFFGHPGA
jgi:hypothetical protein